MKVKIRNLGVVYQAEIDLKPLTVFVGSNNEGKTWVAYALSAILGPEGVNEYEEAYADEETLCTFPSLDAVVQQVWEKGTARFDLIQFADEHGEEYINDVATLARRWMGDFLGTKRASFENLEVEIDLSEKQKQDLLERLRSLSREGEIGSSRQRDIPLLHGLKEKNESNFYFYAQGDLSEELPLRAVRRFVNIGVFTALHDVLYTSYLYPFPTERTTYITLPFAGFSQEAVERLRRIEPPPQRLRISRPVGNFLSWTADAFTRSLSERYEEAKDEPNAQRYIELSQILEKEILGGQVDFSTSEPERQRELLFHPAQDVELGMPCVSSMVKELTPLVLCLRYMAEPGEWLIIDEPEMNLHPEAQVRLAEFLAMLVQSDLRVLFTTHSTYIVDHLVNLMKAAEHEDREKIRKKFYLGRTEALIPKEQVSVYLFKGGEVRSVLDEDGLIDWGTFGDVSDRVSQLYFEI